MSMCDLILGWDIMVGLSQDLLGLHCGVLLWSRAYRVGLSEYTMLGLTKSYILGLRGRNRLWLSSVRWGKAKVKAWSLIVVVPEPRIEGWAWVLVPVAVRVGRVAGFGQNMAIPSYKVILLAWDSLQNFIEGYVGF